MAEGQVGAPDGGGTVIIPSVSFTSPTISNPTFTGVSKFPDGTVCTAPSITFTSDVTTGFALNAAGDLRVCTASTSRLAVSSSSLTSSQAILAGTDNSFDIGASGATRFRSFYFGTALIGPGNAAATGAIRLANTSAIIARNNLNTGDVQLISSNSSDRVQVGNGSTIDLTSSTVIQGSYLADGSNTRDLFSTGSPGRNGYFATSLTMNSGIIHLGTAAGSGGEYIKGWEQSADPTAPASNSAVLFFKDNGSGKTQACVRFPTGATQCFATEP